MGHFAKLWNIHIYYIYGGITGHQPQQGRCPKMVTDISNSLYRILWIKKVTIQIFIKIGWKTWKLCQYLLRRGCARDLSENMKLWNSMRFGSLPTMRSFFVPGGFSARDYGIAFACSLFVCLSVCLSVCLWILQGCSVTFFLMLLQYNIWPPHWELRCMWS